MGNYRALGVEKEMQNEFDSLNPSDLKMLMDSSYFEAPYITRRNADAVFCEIMVIDCQHKDWWYKNLIGFKFFCEIIYKRCERGTYISRFVGVKLTGTKKIIFRDFDPKDVAVL